MTIIMKKEKAIEDLFSFSKAYSWRVLLTVFAISLIMGIVMFLFEKFSPYSAVNTKSENISRTQIHYGLERSIFFSFGALTLSGGDHVPHTISTRVLLSGFWFFRLNTFILNIFSPFKTYLLQCNFVYELSGKSIGNIHHF